MPSRSVEGRADKVTATFELTVVGHAPLGARFFGDVVRGMMTESEEELTDPSDTKVYSGSVQIERGVERGVGIVVRYEGLSDAVEDFGLTAFDQDKVFSSTVSWDQLFQWRSQ